MFIVFFIFEIWHLYWHFKRSFEFFKIYVKYEEKMKNLWYAKGLELRSIPGESLLGGASWNTPSNKIVYSH